MSAAAAVSPEAAVRHCRELTRERARNFYYGLKLLPEPQRSALYVIYAWMRRADDLVDDLAGRSDVDVAAARRRVDELRARTDEALAGEGDERDPVLVGLGLAAARFGLPAAPFHAMLDGQLDDLAGRTYETFDDLRGYCEQVASTVGLLCIEVWGYEGADAPRLAIDRGIALQLTNILRDLAEDMDDGRVYLPAEDFRRHGLEPADLRAWRRPERCRAFMDEQIVRAERYYERSAALDDCIDPTCLPTLWAMTTIYRRLLAQMRAHPQRVLTGPRVRLTALNKGSIALWARWGALSRSRRVRGEALGAR